MSAEDEENIDSLNDTSEEDVKTDDIEGDAAEDKPEDKPEYTEFEKKQYNRAKQEEAKRKEVEKKLKIAEAQLAEKNESPEKQGDITVKDSMALINAKVTEDEDIESVVEYAKFKKISVQEALKSSVVKTLLAEKLEERKTADATNTGAGRRGSTKVSDDAMLDNADKGKYPEDAEDLAEARMANKLKKLKK